MHPIPWGTAALTALVLVSFAPSGRAPTRACHAFVVRAHDEIVLERIDVPEGRTIAVPAGPGSGVVDVVAPVGPGGSASLVRVDERPFLVLRCRDGALGIVARGAEGSERPLGPERPMADLAGWEIRVSVSGGERDAAFRIRDYGSVARDTIGPVENPFRGRIPLAPGEWVVFTETWEDEAAPPARGEAPLEMDGWPFVPASAGGAEGDLLVDVGASMSLVERGFLPPGTAIDPATMVEHSAAGRRVRKAAPRGATGVVEVAGVARIPELRVGRIAFTDVRVEVVEALPDWFGRDVSGILGLDLLRRSPVATFAIGEGRLRLTGEASRDEGAIEIPFSLARHIHVRGRVDGVPVSFVVDTGAPDALVDAPVAERLGWTTSGAPDSVRGLDRSGAEAWWGEGTLVLGGEELAEVRFRVSPLPFFGPIRSEDQLVGLLGNSVFERFAALEIDFRRDRLRLVPRGT